MALGYVFLNRVLIVNYHSRMSDADVLLTAILKPNADERKFHKIYTRFTQSSHRITYSFIMASRNANRYALHREYGAEFISYKGEISHMTPQGINYYVTDKFAERGMMFQLTCMTRWGFIGNISYEKADGTACAAPAARMSPEGWHIEGVKAIHAPLFNAHYAGPLHELLNADRIKKRVATPVEILERRSSDDGSHDERLAQRTIDELRTAIDDQATIIKTQNSLISELTASVDAERKKYDNILARMRDLMVDPTPSVSSQHTQCEDVD